jgi:hypothetical protein
LGICGALSVGIPMSWLSGYGTYSTRLSTQPQTHTMHSGTYTFLLTLHVLTDTFFKHEQAQVVNAGQDGGKQEKMESVGYVPLFAFMFY